MEESGMFEGFTDWHSHILPGVDDGIHTLEESLAVLHHYEKLGVDTVWLTPHIMEEYPNSTTFLHDRYQDLKREYQGPIKLYLASENMLDSLFEERLRNRDILPLGEHADHLLVETSYINPPIGMEPMIQQVLSEGLTPILAHPERYRYMDKSDYERWKSRGVLFQCNYVSLLGGYGNTAKEKVEWLLQEGMIDITGSDLHRYMMLEHILPKRPKNASAMEVLVDVARNGKLLS